MSMLAGLDAEARRLASTTITDLIRGGSGACQRFRAALRWLYANFARQRYDRAALDALFAMAKRGIAGRHAPPAGWRDRQPTEGRAALAHRAARRQFDAAGRARGACAGRGRASADGVLIAQLEASDVTDIVSVGIGGSDLGPRLVADALRDPLPGALPRAFPLQRRWRGRAAHAGRAGPARTAGDPDLQDLRHPGNPAQRRHPARLAGRQRAPVCGQRQSRARRRAFGIAAERVLPMWDWVGGRYSLWSAVGFPIALAIGMDRFEQLLAGAARWTRMRLAAPLRGTSRCWHALTAVWNRNALGMRPRRR
jgi:glucose-6-phosphate isomerase